MEISDHVSKYPRNRYERATDKQNLTTIRLQNFFKWQKFKPDTVQSILQFYTTYIDWILLWFSSAPPGKCSDIISIKLGFFSFQILPNLFTKHPAIDAQLYKI